MATISPPTTQTADWQATIEGCLLVGIGGMLMRKTWDGQLPLYIHPRYTALIGVTAALLLLIGAVRLWQTGGNGQGLRGRHGVYGLLLTPLVLGVLIPAKPAGSALVDPQTLNSVGRGYRTASAKMTDDTSQWNLLDWMFARYTLKPNEAADKPVDVVGFVYREQGQATDQFYVVRYTLACCIADRSGVSLPVTWADAARLHNDQWVRVTGTIAVQQNPNQTVAELVVENAQVTPVDQPQEPYLYP